MTAETRPMPHVPSDVVSLVALYGVVVVVGLVLLVLLVLRLTASSRASAQQNSRDC